MKALISVCVCVCVCVCRYFTTATEKRDQTSSMTVKSLCAPRDVTQAVTSIIN